MNAAQVLVAGYARTPFVRSNGRFATVAATTLGGLALTAALERAGVRPDQVDLAVGGQVLQAGAGQNPARQSAVAAGIPLTVPAVTINAVCLSGTEAVAHAARAIRAGEADVVVAFGQESMSLAPHVWTGSRAGTRFGAVELLDSLEHDGLTDAFSGQAMGLATDVANDDLGIDRAVQDRWAARSHQRVEAAIAAGTFDDEIVAVDVSTRRSSTTVSCDDGPRAGTTVETLAALRPAFRPGGGISAGNASPISDGAAAVVLVGSTSAAARGLNPLAEVLAHALVAGPDTSLQAKPAVAVRAALRRAGRGVEDLRLVEVNEAFAAVAVHSTRELGVADEIVNVHGGAVALGHPVGASGARIVGHLARALAARGPGSLGAAGICGGGGQGSAILLRAL